MSALLLILALLLGACATVAPSGEPNEQAGEVFEPEVQS